MKTIHAKAALASLVLLIAMASCSTPPGGIAYDQGQSEKEIREIEHSWAQVAVSGDPAVIEHIFADDFLGVAPDGMHYTKQGFIDDTKANPLGFKSIELDDMKLRFIGNIAVAQGQETFTRKDGSQGRFVWTDVLERGDGKWQIIAAEDVVAPVGEQSAGEALFPGSAQPEDAKQEIDRTRGEYVSAWRAANADQIAGLYTEDAQVLYPNQPPVNGRDAIHAYFTSFFEAFTQAEFELTSSEIVVTGAWAFDRGAYRWKGVPRDGSAPIEDNGKYLVVLQQQPDGRWRVARDMDNSDRPAAQATRGTE